MDISIVNVAMPQMLSTFGVSLDAITWVAVAYSISEIILVTMAAWFSRLLGRKRFFVLSFILFTAASILCGLARSLEMMILARMLQGIGGGGLIPVAQAIMLETFPEEERGMAMAISSMGITLAPAVGPVLGGWLTDQYGWPWIFYINLPLGILGIVLSIIVLSDPPHMQRSLVRIDVVGIALLAIGLTALQLVLERGEREDWFESSFVIALSLTALVTPAVLVVWVCSPWGGASAATWAMHSWRTWLSTDQPSIGRAWWITSHPTMSARRKRSMDSRAVWPRTAGSRPEWRRTALSNFSMAPSIAMPPCWRIMTCFGSWACSLFSRFPVCAC